MAAAGNRSSGAGIGDSLAADDVRDTLDGMFDKCEDDAAAMKKPMVGRGSGSLFANLDNDEDLRGSSALGGAGFHETRAAPAVDDSAVQGRSTAARFEDELNDTFGEGSSSGQAKVVTEAGGGDGGGGATRRSAGAAGDSSEGTAAGFENELDAMFGDVGGNETVPPKK